MLQRIAQLLRRLGVIGEGEEDDSTLLTAIAEDGVRVEVREFPLPCGHRGYAIQAEYFVDDFGRWVLVADLRDFNLYAAIQMLVGAARFIDQRETEQETLLPVED
jgi:hypothetical protein